MSQRNHDKLRPALEAFAKSAHLEVLVPRESDFDATAILREGSPEDIQNAPSRRHLFLDEVSKLQVVLKSSTPEDAVRELLPHLELAIAAHATNAVPDGSGNAASTSGKHDIASMKAPASEGVELVTVGDKSYAIWKPSVHLAKGRSRSQQPAIYYTASLIPKNDAFAPSRIPQNEFLPSYEPLPANVLEALRFDPAFTGREIFVSETKITKVAPLTSRAEDSIRPIRGATKRAFPAVPALFTRIRYSSIQGSLLASVHLETSQLIAGDVILNNAELQVPGVTVERLNDLSWPRKTHAGDENVVVFKITKSKHGIGAETEPMALASASVDAVAILEQGSQIDLKIEWQAQIDLSGFGALKFHEWSRPPSTSSLAHKQVPSKESTKLSEREKPSTQDETNGLVFNFSGPPTTQPGATFALKVQCLNKTDRDRKFALVIPQPRKSSNDLQQKGRDVHVITPDVRVGPVAPNASFETTIKYRALAPGTLALGTIRIMDLISKRTVDVLELPDVFCVASS